MADPQPIEIHISDVRSYKACRYKWNFSSHLKRNLEPNVPYVPFFTGRAVHHCLQQMYRNHGDVTTLIPSLDQFIDKETKTWTQPIMLPELEMINEQRELMVGMFTHYALWRYTHSKETSPWLDQNLNFVSLEMPFKDIEIPGLPGATFAGRFDGLVEDNKGKFWIWENKTARSISELQKSLANDEQSGLYTYAASKVFGRPVEGVLYNIMRKKLPTTPKILKSGELSKDKSVDTSWEWYKQTVDSTYPQMSQDDKEDLFGEFIQQLQDDPKKQFFARIPVKKSQATLDQLIDQLAATAREMIDPRTAIYPAPGVINCNWCLFRNPCIAMSRRQFHEAEQMLADDYRIRINYDEEQEALNEENGN